MSDFFYKHTKKVLEKTNSQLSKIGYSLIIKNSHVIERLKSRKIDSIDFINALNLLTSKHLCELIYFSSLDRPFYKFEAKTENIILAIGFEEADNKKFIIRTVLDPKFHNKYEDEDAKLNEARIFMN